MRYVNRYVLKLLYSLKDQHIVPAGELQQELVASGLHSIDSQRDLHVAGAGLRLGSVGAGDQLSNLLGLVGHLDRGTLGSEVAHGNSREAPGDQGGAGGGGAGEDTCKHVRCAAGPLLWNGGGGRRTL